MADIEVSKRFFAAAQLGDGAARAHGSRTPSVAQVLGVASLVLGDGGTKREAIAGMIVDASRGTDCRHREIRRPRREEGRPARRGVHRRRSPTRSASTHEPDLSVLRVCAAVTVRDVQDLSATSAGTAASPSPASTTRRTGSSSATGRSSRCSAVASGAPPCSPPSCGRRSRSSNATPSSSTAIAAWRGRARRRRLSAPFDPPPS